MERLWKCPTTKVRRHKRPVWVWTILRTWGAWHNYIVVEGVWRKRHLVLQECVSQIEAMVGYPLTCSLFSPLPTMHRQSHLPHPAFQISGIQHYPINCPFGVGPRAKRKRGEKRGWERGGECGRREGSGGRGAEMGRHELGPIDRRKG